MALPQLLAALQRDEDYLRTLLPAPPLHPGADITLENLTQPQLRRAALHSSLGDLRRIGLQRRQYSSFATHLRELEARYRTMLPLLTSTATLFATLASYGLDGPLTGQLGWYWYDINDALLPQAHRLIALAAAAAVTHESARDTSRARFHGLEKRLKAFLVREAAELRASAQDYDTKYGLIVARNTELSRRATAIEARQAEVARLIQTIQQWESYVGQMEGEITALTQQLATLSSELHAYRFALTWHCAANGGSGRVVSDDECKRQYPDWFALRKKAREEGTARLEALIAKAQADIKERQLLIIQTHEAIARDRPVLAQRQQALTKDRTSYSVDTEKATADLRALLADSQLRFASSLLVLSEADAAALEWVGAL
jgi:hypothetical protein